MKNLQLYNMKQKQNLKLQSRIILVIFLTITAMTSVCCSDDGNEHDAAHQVEKTSVSGIIEKGPFVQGSKVTLYELTADLLQTGKSFKTQTTNDLGAFRFETPMTLKSQFVEVETSGYFYNEVKGKLSASQITLNALSNVENRNSVNVNLITHLEFDRVKKLVHNGKSFNEAKRQAEEELLACFAITDEITSPENISLTDNNKNSAMLLAISTVMLYDKSEAEFTEFIAKFSSDFADNGKIDNSLIRETISEGEKNAHPKEVIERMKEFYANKGVTMECDDFSQFIDFNGDGVLDENDKEGEYTFVNSSLFDAISKNADLSLFKQILVRAGYDKILSTYGAMTIFAPSNEGLGVSDIESLSDATCLDIAKRYILSDAVPTSYFLSGNRFVTNLLGEAVSVNEEEGIATVFIKIDNGSQTKQAQITTSNIECFNGYLNIIDDTFLEIEPMNEIVEESFWGNKGDVLLVLNATYNASLQFATSLLKLEGLRTDNQENVHSITPRNSTLSETYQSAYKAINYANTLLYYAPNVQNADPTFTESDYKTVIAEAKCLRAFAYYNLAMLWGNVIFITQPSTGDDDFEKSQSKQSEIYQFVYSDICDAIANLPSSYKTELETKARFTRNAGLMLKAEIELTLGRSNDAKSTLSHVENAVHFGFITQEQTITPIYTPNHLTLFNKEAEGSTNELAQEWQAMTESKYGYWAALKRLGQAQEVTGCFNYELLMPFPSQELRLNRQMVQNPGY